MASLLDDPARRANLEMVLERRRREGRSTMSTSSLYSQDTRPRAAPANFPPDGSSGMTNPPSIGDLATTRDHLSRQQAEHEGLARSLHSQQQSVAYSRKELESRPDPPSQQQSQVEQLMRLTDAARRQVQVQQSIAAQSENQLLMARRQLEEGLQATADARDHAQKVEMQLAERKRKVEEEESQSSLRQQDISRRLERRELDLEARESTTRGKASVRGEHTGGDPYLVRPGDEDDTASTTYDPTSPAPDYSRPYSRDLPRGPGRTPGWDGRDRGGSLLAPRASDPIFQTSPPRGRPPTTTPVPVTSTPGSYAALNSAPPPQPLPPPAGGDTSTVHTWHPSPRRSYGGSFFASKTDYCNFPVWGTDDHPSRPAHPQQQQQQQQQQQYRRSPSPTQHGSFFQHPHFQHPHFQQQQPQQQQQHPYPQQMGGYHDGYIPRSPQPITFSPHQDHPSTMQHRPQLSMDSILNDMKSGDWFIKWTKNDKPHLRWFWLNLKKMMLYWSNTQSASTIMSNYIRLQEVVSIRAEQLSEESPGDPGNPQVYYLMIINTYKRQLNIASKDRDKYNKWFEGLSMITRQYRQVNEAAYAQATNPTVAKIMQQPGFSDAPVGASAAD